MSTATIAAPQFARPETSSALRLWAARAGAKLRYLIELSAAPHLVRGARYL